MFSAEEGTRGNGKTGSTGSMVQPIHAQFAVEGIHDIISTALIMSAIEGRVATSVSTQSRRAEPVIMPEHFH